jgi:CDP-diacylglycerol--serine O-phosphatidyltransferase
VRVNLRKTLFILPNLFTLSSIFCGFYATVLCASAAPDAETFYRAALLIVFAAFFDVIDGRVARLTKTQSAFGVQIDSLADVVSFGVAPSVLVYQWSLHSLGLAGAFFAFAFCACGAIRLARFNVLTMTKTSAPKKPPRYIVGLPIPGAAGVLVALVLANHSVAGNLPQQPYIVLGAVLALSFFMVSTIKFRSFKDLKNRRTAVLFALLLGSSAVVALSFNISFALVSLPASYIALGVAETIVRLSRRGLGLPLAPLEEEEEPSETKV